MQPVEPKVPCLTILSHPDSQRVGERAVLWSEPEREGEALLARQVLAFGHPTAGEGKTLDDPYISRRPIRFTAARFGGIRLDCSESGTRVVANGDWIPEDRVFLGVEVERGVVLVLAERLALLLHNLDARHRERQPQFGLVGESPRIEAVRREVQRLASTSEPALLRGPSGVGKKAVARAIHAASDRQELPYLTVRMIDPASIAPAKDLVAQASGGTLVLDAAEKTPQDLQKELLAAIEDAGARGNGIRLLASTSDSGRRNLDTSAGPLMDRLSQDVVDVPSLEKMRDDVARLTFHFLHQELARVDALHCLKNPGVYAPPWFPVRLVARLVSYEWPRNVSQLQGVTRFLAMEHYQKDHVDIGSDIELLLEGTAETSGPWEWPEEATEEAGAHREPAEVSEIELLTALRNHRWQAEPTAAELGITPEALFSMIEQFSERTRRHKTGRR